MSPVSLLQGIFKCWRKCPQVFATAAKLHILNVFCNLKIELYSFYSTRQQFKPTTNSEQVSPTILNKNYVFWGVGCKNLRKNCNNSILSYKCM